MAVFSHTKRTLVTALAAVGVWASVLPAQAQQAPLKIGLTTAVQLQVGRDTQEAAKIAIDEINAKGGVMGRKLSYVVADETENPEVGINAIKS